VGLLIDTSIFVAAERGRLALDELRRREGKESVALAAITASELLHGVRGGDSRPVPGFSV
jgi:tRNA(fMet)-specific endonuclease VapC